MATNEETIGDRPADERIERIRKIRGGNRGATTRLINESNELIHEHMGRMEIDVLARMQSISIGLKEKRRYIEELDRQILDKCHVNDIEREIDEATETTTKIVETIMKLESFANGKYSTGSEEQIQSPVTIPNASTPTRNTAPSASIERSNSSNGLLMRQQIRLPKMNLPKFNGDITRFQAFWQSFRCSIDENDSLSGVHKLNYLVSLLEGPAYKALQGLDVTDENYGHAIEILKTRFGRTQQIISAHMTELLNLQNFSNDRTNDLRSIYDNINVHIRGLESLGVSSERYGCLLVPVIMKRMPNEIALQVARKTSEDVWDINEIMEIIRKEIEARELSKGITVTERVSKPIMRVNQQQNQPTGTTRSFIAKNDKPRKIECYFCTNSHYSNECTIIKDIEKRKSLLMDAKRCFNCLRIGHISKNCQSNFRCKKCNRRHNTAICDHKADGGDDKKERKQDAEATTITTATSKGKTNVLLQTARAHVFGEDKAKKIAVNILFDGGSQKSYITESLKKRLALKSEKTETINLNTFGSEKSKKQSCESIQINLEVGENVMPITALSFPTICSPMASRVDINNYPHLQGLQLADTFSNSDKHIGLLIGADHYHDIVTGEVIKGSAGPTATYSKLGWLLSGPVCVNRTENDIVSCSNVISTLAIDILPPDTEIDEVQEITDSLKQFWRHESAGLTTEAMKDEQISRKQSVNESNIQFNEKEKRYKVSLPWKENISEPLPSDKDLCQSRLNSLYNRLKGNPELLREYDAIFKEQLANGIIEKVPDNQETKGDTHFICHHGVVKRDRETTKLRVVFDGSARSAKDVLSLNDRLEIGDNYMPLLFDTFIRFRSHPVVLTADIEKAFLQIEINEADRDVLRFLWYDDVTKDNPSIVQFRHRRLIFGLKCSPALLNATIREHVDKFTSEHAEVVNILSRLYADDLSCGAETTGDAFVIYEQAKAIMLKGGFNLRKWNSNDNGLLARIKAVENKCQVPTDKAAQGNKVTEDDESYSQFAVGNPIGGGKSKVLGIHWDSDSDRFYFDLKNNVEFAKSLPPTKRSVLRLAAKIFDPLGCLSVFTINLKVFFQQLCINNVSWDQKLSEPDRKQFEGFISDLEELHDIHIPRCLFVQGKVVKKIELHGFSDASERAHGCVVYVRIEYETGEVDTRFIASKAKVNPIKKQSIPRLELLGACLLAKLVESIKQSLQDELKGPHIETFYWVDSMCTLCWIRNCKPWNQYVRHRVAEILKSSDRTQWFYCPGPQNPADLPSRGIYRKNFDAHSFWWEGPQFLKSGQDKWPKLPTESEIETNDIALSEKMKNEPYIIHAMLASNAEAPGNIEQVVDMSRFSSKGKLLSTIAWVVRFVANLKAAVKKQESNKEEKLSVAEINVAENSLIRSIQKEAFPKEISYLVTKATSKPPVYVSQFNLFIDNDKVLRCSTRIKNANVTESSKRPILLPSKSRYSELLIADCHDKVFHNGTRDTLNLLRQRYWVLRGRECVRRVTKRCILCKKIEGLPYKSVYSSNLPEFRVDDSPPFTHTGIDFAGPLMVSDKESAKYYVCLFTCAVTRAVHLELVESLDVESFIRAFRRFCARRGLPGTILSDNAKTFKSASKEIKKLIRSPRLREHFTSQGVKWKFIIELAPWQGGMWERLVRSTKRCLIKIIGRSVLTYSELNTVLVEIESVINSRPLTYVFDDTEGLSYPLTPSQLINGRNLQRLPNDGHYELVSTYEGLSKRARYHHRLLTQFASRWKNEYLLSLLEAYRPRNGNKEPIIGVGDIVILRNDQQKRSFWKLAKILELYQGQDGSVRSAKIQVAGDSKKVFNRSLRHLIPLEIPNQSASDSENHASALIPNLAQAQQQVPSQQHARSRSRRNAAIIGEISRKDVM